MRSAYFVMAKMAGIPILSTVSVIFQPSVVGPYYYYFYSSHDFIIRNEILYVKRKMISKKKKSKKGLTVK